MNRYTRIGFVLATAAALIGASQPLHGTDIGGRELFGIRIGGVFGSNALENAYGKGTEIELHFIEGLGSWFGLSVAVSSHNFGDSKDRDKNIECTQWNRNVEMQIYSATVAFFGIRSLGEKFSISGEAGFGLYTITTIIHAGMLEGHLTDNQFGMYCGAGVLYKLTQSLSLNMQGKYHYILSGGDMMHCYTGEKRAQLYQIVFGIMIFTG
ncbi:MAG: hypothetical protein JSV33_10355 [bacterium]|nr:MAG: hypothetical protein JSV33_10355 [bacterium]